MHLKTVAVVVQVLQPQMLLMNRELYASAAASNNVAFQQQVQVRSLAMFPALPSTERHLCCEQR